jgi:histidinol-phosphate aminotransferase
MTAVPRPRAAVEGLPVYKPGKSAEVAMREHDLVSAIKLASNENPYAPLPSVVEAIAATATATLARYADHRATAVREALAERHGLAVEQVAVGCGSVGLLQQLLLTYADPGDEVLYGWRSFEAYPIYTQTVGATSVQVPNRFEALDLAAVTKAVTDRTRVVFVTSPNNPTGTVVRAAELVTLLEAVPDGAVVVLDEAYHEYITGAQAPPALALLQQFPNLVVLRTFSKAYGLAGLRLGCAVARPPVIDCLARVRSPYSVNGLAAILAEPALRDRSFVRRYVAEVRRVRPFLRSELSRRGIRTWPSAANFVLARVGARSNDLQEFLRTEGILVRDQSGQPELRGCVRIGVGTRPQARRLLEALDRWLRREARRAAR